MKSKKNRELMVFIHDDQPDKITKKIISLRSIAIYIVIAAGSIAVILNQELIIDSIRSNIENIRKIDSIVDKHAAYRREIRASYDSLQIKLKQVSSLEDSIIKQSKMIAPELYKSASESNLAKSKNRAITIDRIEDISKDALMLREFFISVLTLYNEDSDIFNYTPTASPVDTPFFISRKYGKYIDPFTNKKKLHEGFNFLGNIGDPVYASGRGTVLRTGMDRHFGRFIEIRHRDGITTYYSHLDRISVSQGQRVDKGKKIGTMGNSGLSISPNLHFEIRENGTAVDPKKYLIIPL